MARTPLLRSLINLARAQRAADARGIPLSGLHEQRAMARERGGPALSRRSLLIGGAAATGTLLTGCPSPGTVPPAGGASGKKPKIAIVGAGIAGLSAALELADRGVASTVYEASGRSGGRMFSNSSYFDDGQVFEWYGELIDTPHKVVRSLAQRFGITIDNLVEAQPAGSHETYHFFGKHYPRADAERDMQTLMPILLADMAACGPDSTYDSMTGIGRKLDDMSVYDWIDQRVPGGHGSPLGMLLDTAYFIELNVDTREQSALNIIYVLGSQLDWKNFEMYGSSDECMKVRGGNQKITDAMAAHLAPGTLQMGKRMEALVKRASGDYELTLRRANTTETVVADAVILTLPFAVLRDLDYSKAGFDALKHKAIQELGRGRQSKQHLQFKRRIWNDNGSRPYPGTGTSYSDTGYQVTWEATRAQAGQQGILVAYCGGHLADAMATKVAVSTAKIESVGVDAKTFLQRAEPVFPGIGAEWNGKATQGLPHLDPNFKCSYSHWRIGQCQSIRGYERVPQGGVYFAGEHTSVDFQGFMEGGADEGQQAARALMAALGVGGPPPAATTP